jgi:AraC-like DNA-binding protein
MAAEHDALVLRERIVRHLGGPVHAARETPLARRVRDLLDARYAESLTITAIAAELDVHPSHLVRVFTQTYGIPPHRYLVSRRVDHARRLLVDGHRPADVAARTGFHDQSHLTRHFRRILGATPSAFAA